jgi:hypothetical protein
MTSAAPSRQRVGDRPPEALGAAHHQGAAAAQTEIHGPAPPVVPAKTLPPAAPAGKAPPGW